MVQILSPEGVMNEQLRPKELTDKVIKTLYQKMVFAKVADQKILNLQRQGKMGTYPSIRGQEAIQAGSAYALQKNDWMVPAFRELCAMWMHGIPMKDLFLYWMGNEWGSHAPEGVNVLPISIPVGTQPLHAVGLAMGIKKKTILAKGKPVKTKATQKNARSGDHSTPQISSNLPYDQVVVTYFGDGATSHGDCMEAINFAGLFQVPVVFICQNNQWAISVPREKQTATKTLAQKAIVGEIPGVQVDGNDLIASYAVTKEAVDRARNGEGATFIEAVTYRIQDHTTSDSAARYRDEKTHETWVATDPMLRLQKYLTLKKLWSEEEEEKLEKAAIAEVEKIFEQVAQTVLNPEDIFDYMYADLPENLKQQKENLLEFINRHPDATKSQHG